MRTARGHRGRQGERHQVSKWHLDEDHVANLERLAKGPRTGEILAVPVDVPGAGRP